MFRGRRTVHLDTAAVTGGHDLKRRTERVKRRSVRLPAEARRGFHGVPARRDRKSTRLNSSHLGISYAVFCLKKRKKMTRLTSPLDVVMCPAAEVDSAYRR